MPCSAALKKKAGKIFSALLEEYPEAKTSLEFRNPYELLVATILSAQCTDERVNKVAKALFEKYPSAQELAGAEIAALEDDVHSTGFYKNKARNIRACAAALVEKYGGTVPGTLEKLTALPGVGRKTANVVLGNAFGKPAVVIETHVLRIAGRLGLTREKDPVKIESEFMELFPEKDWSRLAPLFIDFGRAVCKAVNPQCKICKLRVFCEYSRGLKS